MSPSGRKQFFIHCQHRGERFWKIVGDAAFQRHERLWKPGTMAVNRSYLRNRLLPHFAGRPVAAAERVGRTMSAIMEN